MHPEIMPPACYENHISFFLYTEKGGHKGVGVIECEGLPQTSPSHPLSGTGSLYFPPLLLFTTSKRLLLSLSCWPAFGLNGNFWKWYFHPYRIGTV